MKHDRLKGALFTVLGGVLWGFSGTCGQFLMQTKGLPSNWIVPIRLLSAGVILLLLCLLRRDANLFRVWKKDAPAILIFGLFGMSMCQYTYFTAIGCSNAGTATVLQYLGPVLIMILMSLQARRFPRPLELLAVFLAVAGTFLLATHGNPGTMVLSKEALFWGLLSACALVVYTVQPVRLLERYGSPVVTAWGMLVGGGALMLLFRPWTIPVSFDGECFWGLAAVVLMGTVIAFTIYLEGIRCVGPKKGSLYASVEPVSATVFSVILMGVSFTGMDLLGFACIISTIFLLSVDRQNP